MATPEKDCGHGEFEGVPLEGDPDKKHIVLESNESVLRDFSRAAARHLKPSRDS